MSYPKIQGLVAAACTPMGPGGELALSGVPAYVDHLVKQGVSGLYVLGSTGEGASLSGTERRAVAEAYVQGADGRVPVIVQVGHNSLVEAAELAAHAQVIGADGVSAFAPSYFKSEAVDQVTRCMAQIAAGAPDLPFYYYHAPGFTGVRPDLLELLGAVGKAIPNFAGIKFTDQRVFEFQACLDHVGGRYDILWGCDEMLLSGLAAGGLGAVGSTYNIAAPLYQQLIAAFRSGDLEEARACQLQSVKLVQVLQRFPIFAAIKEVLRWRDLPMGPCRLPLESLPPGRGEALRRAIEEAGLLPIVLESAADATVPGEC